MMMMNHMALYLVLFWYIFTVGENINKVRYRVFLHANVFGENTTCLEIPGNDLYISLLQKGREGVNTIKTHLRSMFSLECISI